MLRVHTPESVLARGGRRSVTRAPGSSSGTAMRASGCRVQKRSGAARTPQRNRRRQRAWSGHSLHASVTTQGSCDVIDRREAWPVPHEHLVQVFLLPCGHVVELECEDHDGPASNAAKLPQAGGRRLPVVDRHTGHRSVERTIIERKSLGASIDGGRGTGGALRTHRRARLDSENPPLARPVRSRPRTDVEHRACIAEGGVDPSGDPRVRAPMLRIGPPVQLVVDPTRHVPTVASASGSDRSRPNPSLSRI